MTTICREYGELEGTSCLRGLTNGRKLIMRFGDCLDREELSLAMTLELITSGGDHLRNDKKRREWIAVVGKDFQHEQ
jgi:hypothetical protein